MSKLRNIILVIMACLALAASSQPTQEKTEWEWYLDEVISDVFVGRNYFEYYYSPSAAEMEQQRAKGEVSYFLNSPEGLNTKKVRDMIDRLMASYDDVKAVGDWHTTTTIYWKEFRFDKNKFRFSVKRKMLDDGTYYVSVTETAGYYKSLGKKDKKQSEEERPKASSRKSARHSTRDRRPVTQEDVDASSTGSDVTVDDDEAATEPVMSERERRRAARQREEASRQEERLAKRQAQEERRAQEKAQKEAEKKRKAEEKAKKEEEKRLKKEEERERRQQARQEREQARRDKEAASTRTAAAAQSAASKFHYNDVALWLSEKYDFTQTGGDESSCTMYSTAVKDVEMAKLAIKNALKGSNARMAVPWRVNGTTQEVETGYTVDGHVLVFAIGKNENGHITMTITEVSNEDFESFKTSLQRAD